MGRARTPEPAVAQGAFPVVGGLWPLLHPRSLERVFGPTPTSGCEGGTTGGLPVSAGFARLAAAPDPPGVPGPAVSDWGRTASTLPAVDLLPAVKPGPPGRSSSACASTPQRAWRAFAVLSIRASLPARRVESRGFDVHAHPARGFVPGDIRARPTVPLIRSFSRYRAFVGRGAGPKGMNSARLAAHCPTRGPAEGGSRRTSRLPMHGTALTEGT